MTNFIERRASGTTGAMKAPSVDEIESLAQRCLAEDGWQPDRRFDTLVGMSPESFVSEVEGGHKRKLEQRLAARFQGSVGDRMRGDLVKWLSRTRGQENTGAVNLETIHVTEAGEKAFLALKTVTGSQVLQGAFEASWKRVTRRMSKVTIISAGDIAIGSLKGAMDAVATPSELRTNLIGMFCNEWNALTHPDAHRMSTPPQAAGARSTPLNRA